MIVASASVNGEDAKNKGSVATQVDSPAKASSGDNEVDDAGKRDKRGFGGGGGGYGGYSAGGFGSTGGAAAIAQQVQLNYHYSIFVN